MQPCNTLFHVLIHSVSLYSGGTYVKVADRMYAKYFVGDRARTYKFKLTIWDPETKERVDFEYVFVEINGGKLCSIMTCFLSDILIT